MSDYEDCRDAYLREQIKEKEMDRIEELEAEIEQLNRRRGIGPVLKSGFMRRVVKFLDQKTADRIEEL